MTMGLLEKWRSLQHRDGWVKQTSDFVSQTFGETSLYFKANYVIIFQVSVLLIGVILPLLLTKNKWWIIPYITFFICMYAVLTDWIRQYYTAAAKKQATLAKHDNIPKAFLIEKQDWLSAAQVFVTGLFNGKVDPCEAYYTAAMVDPALRISLFLLSLRPLLCALCCLHRIWGWPWVPTTAASWSHCPGRGRCS